MSRLVAWAAIATLSVYLLFIGGGWLGIYSSGIRVVSIVLAATALVVWFVIAIRLPAWRPRSVIWPAIAAGLLSLAVSTAASRVPGVSAEYLAYAVLLAGLYLLLVRLSAHPYFQRRLATLAVMCLAVICLLYIGLTMAHWIEWWGLVGRFALPPLRPSHEGLTYLNPSAVLTMAVLLAIPTIATFGGSTRRGVGITLAIGAVIAVVALMAGSRAGWLALAVTAIVVSAMWVSSGSNRQMIRGTASRLWAVRAGRVGLIAAAGVVLGGAVIFGPAIAARASEGGEDLRLTYSATALRMFTDSPMLGTGPGTWVIQRIAYTADTEPDYYIPHAHNIEAQTLAELGLGGVLAGLVVVLVLMRLVRGGMRDPDPTRRRWAWAGTAGLIYFGLHQQLDFYANMPAALFAIAIPVAFLDATAMPIRKSGTALRPAGVARRLQPIMTLGLLGVLVASAFLMWREIPAGDLARSVASADSGDWSGAAAPALDAVALDPEIGTAQLVAGLVKSRQGKHEAAAAAFERVARRDDLPEAWLDLAAERAALGDTNGALAAAHDAFRLGRQRPAVSMPVGDLALRLGDPAFAMEAFVAAVSATPSIAGDPWWHADQAREALFGRVMDKALAGAAPVPAWEMAFLAGRADEARQIAAANGFATLAEIVTGAWSGDAGAIASASASCEERPTDFFDLTWCARIDAHSGDVAGAERWRAMADIQFGGGSVFGAELRVAEEGAGEPMAGNAALFWGTFTYRRPGPADLLVPSLVHLRLE